MKHEDIGGGFLRAVMVHGEVPPSSNTNTGVGGRGSPKAIHRTKKRWEQTFGGLLQEVRVPRDLAYARLWPRLEFYGKNGRDADNYYFSIAKPFGDILQNGGWLVKDTPEFFEMRHVRIIEGVRELGPKGARMTLVLDYRRAPSPAP